MYVGAWTDLVDPEGSASTAQDWAELTGPMPCCVALLHSSWPLYPWTQRLPHGLLTYLAQGSCANVKAEALQVLPLLAQLTAATTQKRGYMMAEVQSVKL